MNPDNPLPSSVLVTGSSGFLGSNIFQEINNNYLAIGLSRSRADILVDLALSVPKLTDFKIHSVIHCAGLAHNKGQESSQEKAFDKVNVLGTRNLLQALEGQPLQSMVFISTVSVYGLERGQMITESKVTKPLTPYGKSKLVAEEIFRSWCADRKVPLLILRLPRGTGTNPPGNLAAMYRAVQRGYYFSTAQNQARKSIVAARDIARWLPSVLGKQGTYHLCDGVHPSISQVEQRMAEISGKKIQKMPDTIIKMAARVGDFLPRFPLNNARLKKLNDNLTFSDEKARDLLGWNPGPALDALDFTE